MIGKIISNYKITDFIEEGGMGTVYKGTHIHIDRAVAIKILHQNLTSNPEFRLRFLNEAKILAKLNHPNIVNIYDFIEEGGLFYIVTEFCEGKVLDKLVESGELYSTENCITIFRQILTGIEFAHRNGVIHRELKPSNIIVSSENVAKILDFGIAKLTDTNKSMTKTGTKMGSLYYMSPEQVLGKEVDLRTDIYSLGVLFFEMLTRKIPYNTRTESDYELMNSILTEGVPSLDLYITGFDPYINSIIQKACAKNPEDRFQSCAEFNNAFNDSGFNYAGSTSNHNSTRIVGNNYNQNDHNKTRFVDPGYSQYQEPPKKSNNALILTIIGACVIVTVTLIIILNMSNNSTNSNQITSNELKTNSSDNSGNTGSNSSNSSTNSGNTSKQPPPPVTTTNVSSASSVVSGFINDLGSQDFRGAYSKQRNSSWGSYDRFSSIKSFGGITSTSISSITTNYEFQSEASVTVDYFSYDPYNKNGRYKQEFILSKYNNDWKIEKVKNIQVDTWK